MAEALRVGAVMLAHVRHHDREGRAHREAPREDRERDRHGGKREVREGVRFAEPREERFAHPEEVRHGEGAEPDDKLDRRVVVDRGAAGRAREPLDHASPRPRAGREAQHEDRDHHREHRRHDPEGGEREAHPHHLIEQAAEAGKEEKLEQETLAGGMDLSDSCGLRSWAGQRLRGTGAGLSVAAQFQTVKGGFVPALSVGGMSRPVNGVVSRRFAFR